LNRQETRHLDLLKGRTALYDAIQLALMQLRPYEPGDAVYVIGDGGENASSSSRPQAEKALRESRVRLFALMLPASSYTEEELSGFDNLNSLSNTSGGFVETLGMSPGLRLVDERLTQQIRLHTVRLSIQISAFYSLTVELPESPQKPKHWEVAVVDSGKRRKNVWVGYPHEVPACQLRLAQR
jgi:hypothetical protein